MSMTQSSLLRCTPVRIKRLTESFYSANGSVVREALAAQSAQHSVHDMGPIEDGVRRVEGIQWRVLASHEARQARKLRRHISGERIARRFFVSFHHMYVPPLGPTTPSRGNAFTRAIGRKSMMTLTGWRVRRRTARRAEVRDDHRASHFQLGFFRWTVGVLRPRLSSASFLAKHTMFVWPPPLPAMAWRYSLSNRSISRVSCSDEGRGFRATSEKLIRIIAPEGTQ